jgi:GH15 family glucan-1,4-alpha-glucosidase
MPRDLPLGNGRLLVGFDREYTLRDLYWPHVGNESHVRGARCRFGVWADGRLAWLNEGEWTRALEYEPETLVTKVIARHSGLGLELVCSDVVDLDRDLLLRRVHVRDLTGRAEREVRLFWHHDLDMGGMDEGNTAYYAPELEAVIHYRGPNWLLLNVQAGGQTGVSHYATGSTRHFGREGTWRDAEDGFLSRNAIAQGCVDSVVATRLLVHGSGEAYAWAALGKKLRGRRVTRPAGTGTGAGVLLPAHTRLLEGLGQQGGDPRRAARARDQRPVQAQPAADPHPGRP